MRYAVVIEQAAKNYSAYVPDLPGCVATGATVEETEQLIREAIEFHLSGLRDDGVPIPQPSSHVDYVAVTAYPRAPPRRARSVALRSTISYARAWRERQPAREARMSGKLGRSIAALALCALHVGAQAQAWPAKPIRIIVPFTPGSGTDIIARTVTERLS